MNARAHKPTAVFVPGLRDHMPDHWQTLLEQRLPGSVCVPRLGKANLSLATWVDALDRTIAPIAGPIVLVAHSAGVIIAAHWAAQHGGGRVEGALLATPPDFETPLPAGYPSLDVLRENGWMPVPRKALPFPSVVAVSSNDPLSQPDRAVELARGWRSQLVQVGAVGHLNPASGFGEWPLAEVLLRMLGVDTQAAAAAVPE